MFKNISFKNLKLFILLLLLFAFLGCSTKKHNTITQVSTINLLLNGHYDGEISFKELKKFGDTTIGTFHALDGELIGFDNNFYQIKSDGLAYPVNNKIKTPFAVTTFFKSDTEINLSESLTFFELKDYLNKHITSKNNFYAFKINGSFSYIKTRSVPIQNKPYKPLLEVIKNQPIFEFENVKGYVIGFWSPEYVGAGINVKKYHFHFITEDLKFGGHLLDCKTKELTIKIDNITNFCMILPKKPVQSITKEIKNNLSEIE